jgi:hypothetical protein
MQARHALHAPPGARNNRRGARPVAACQRGLAMRRAPPPPSRAPVGRVLPSLGTPVSPGPLHQRAAAGRALCPRRSARGAPAGGASQRRVPVGGAAGRGGAPRPPHVRRGSSAPAGHWAGVLPRAARLPCASRRHRGRGRPRILCDRPTRPPDGGRREKRSGVRALRSSGDVKDCTCRRGAPGARPASSARPPTRAPKRARSAPSTCETKLSP